MGVLQGTLPASWGKNGVFPMLNDLFLSFNPGLGGALPQAWGADGSSLANVQRLQITNTNITGGLPTTWATQMPGLRSLDVSSNSITGASLRPLHRKPICMILTGHRSVVRAR